MKRQTIIQSGMVLFMAVMMTQVVFAQHDKALYQDKEAGFYENEILPSVAPKSDYQLPKYLSMEFDVVYPTHISDYDHIWHIMPKSQGNTGTCWCFAATSFVESEIFRQTKQQIDLSEMYFVYWEYVDRALDYVETRGETYFAQGSEANALKRIIPKYGCVPDEVYAGKPEYRKFHSHSAMMKSMKQYLKGLNQSGDWNPEHVEQGIRSILDEHMGAVPETFTYKGETYTPLSFYASIQVEVLDFFSFMSTLSAPMNAKAELVEADNWWHSEDYYNVSLDDYYSIIENAVKNGYSICLCGDVSEPGYNAQKEVAVVPDFDIPSAYINAYSRELRLNNQSTTDDHCIHIVGVQEIDGETWFLIKDSGSGGFDGENKGYRFFHEDYIRLKMMNIMLHKDAAKAVLDKIIK